MEEEIRTEAAGPPVEGLIVSANPDPVGDPDDEGDAFIGEPGQV
ncbi:MAG TPA: hypothetical protein VFH48_37325 [Chloroflexota bacterium]|nr:hypothetical protein [Chloroflexota bacterium]